MDKERDQKLKSKIEDFAQVLNSLTSLSDKKKMLWLNIYENAIEDRENANLLLSKLKQSVEDNPVEHHLHGPVLAKYIERMTRANDQILKLAELIQDAEDTVPKDEKVEVDDIYDQIGRK